MSLLKRINGGASGKTADGVPEKRRVAVGPGHSGEGEPKASSASPAAIREEVNGSSSVSTRTATVLPPAIVRSPTTHREARGGVRVRLQEYIIADLDPNLDLHDQAEVRREVEDAFARALEAEGLAITRTERKHLLDEIYDDIVGLGPLEPLLRDDSITEVMVNGPDQVYIERDGKLEETGVTFRNDEHVMRIIDRIIAPLGRRIDESSPMVDARLPDGSRVNAIIPADQPGRAGADHPQVRRDRRSRRTISSASGPRRRRCSTSCAPACRRG